VISAQKTTFPAASANSKITVKRGIQKWHRIELKQELVNMGKLVESLIGGSVRSLQEGDVKLAQEIIDGDSKVNEWENKIDELGTMLIATQQPVAKDLRKIIIAFRMASDLERMADLAVSIAKVTLRIGGDSLVKPLVDIPRMSEMVRQMTTDSIEAFVSEDVDLAYKTCKLDDEVDNLNSQILRELFSYMVEKPAWVTQALQLIFVSRYLERMADHTTNIGENVVYLVRGERPELND
jgi:phosphate transport system protein